MADKKQVESADSSEVIVAKAKDFWEKYNKPVTAIAIIIILLVGGFMFIRIFLKTLKRQKQPMPCLWPSNIIEKIQ
jgi:hypothetical protein